MPDPQPAVTYHKDYDTRSWGECPTRHQIMDGYEGHLPHVADPHSPVGPDVCSWCGVAEVPR